MVLNAALMRRRQTPGSAVDSTICGGPIAGYGNNMNRAAAGRATAVFATGTDPLKMRAILERHLQLPDGPPLDVVRCTPSFTREGGSRSLFQYDVTLRDPDGREWNEVVSGVVYGGDRTQKAWLRLDLADREAGSASHVRRVAYVPELDLLLQVFPFDHRLPALQALMDGSLGGLRDPIMARFGPGDWRLDDWQAEPVRYRVDLRASVKLTIGATECGSGSTAARRFYAKVYASRDQVERAWNVQQELEVALRAAGEPFGLAPVGAYLPADWVLVHHEVEGVSLRHIARGDDPEEAAEAVSRAARAVAALHRLLVAAPAHRTELDRTDPERLHRFAESLRTSRPDLASAVDEIERLILAELDAIGNLPSVPVHGDLKPLHFLVGDDRVVLLDFDKFAAGEPMLDVTSMMMLFRRERTIGASLAGVFAEEYFAHAPAGWEQRLTPHYAWAILAEAAAHATGLGKNPARANTSRSEKRNHRVDLLVEEARAVLAGRA